MSDAIKTAVSNFLKTAPKVFVKPEKVAKVQKDRIPVDRYGLRTTSKMTAVNAAIAALVDAGRADAVLAENLATITGQEVNRVKGHLAWFNRKMVFSTEKGDFVARQKVVNLIPAEVSPNKVAPGMGQQVEAYRDMSHLKSACA